MHGQQGVGMMVRRQRMATWLSLSNLPKSAAELPIDNQDVKKRFRTLFPPMASSAPHAHPPNTAVPNARTSRMIGHKNMALSRALEKAQMAVERDQAGNVRGALASYRSARELLTKARRRMSSEDDALKLDAIARAYDKRISELRESINSEPREDDERCPEDPTSSRICKPSPGARTAPVSRTTPVSRFASLPTHTPTHALRRSPPSAQPLRRDSHQPHPLRRDSHQQWPLTPELETKATVERYMKRKLPERPASRAPRYVVHFDDYYNDDENIDVLIDWWNDLLEGSNRWSMSSDKTLVPSSSAYGSKEYRKSSSSNFSAQRNGSESPTDSVRFWSPPATPIYNGFDHSKIVR